MNFPKEFQDHMVLYSQLCPTEKREGFSDRQLNQIKETAKLFKQLMYDKETAKQRVRSYAEAAFDSLELPTYYNSVDSIVEKVFSP